MPRVKKAVEPIRPRIVVCISALDYVKVYFLDPGQVFPRFGGSSTGLPITKTASIITERHTGSATYHDEFALNDPNFWQWLSNVQTLPDIAVIYNPTDERLQKLAGRFARSANETELVN